MIFRQLFDSISSTYTYIIADSANREACIIDPVKEKVPVYMQLFRELNLNLVLALDTHVHADHVTALGELREKTQCQTRVGLGGDVYCASYKLVDEEIIHLGSMTIKLIHTPGHTSESFCFYLSNGKRNILFTGDTLLIRGTGRTDFQAGDPEDLYNSIFLKLLTLPEDTVVYPGHDYKGYTSSTLGEEKSYNPRLQLNKNEFIDHMNNLNLPDPKMMDVAVPANLSCGNL